MKNRLLLSTLIMVILSLVVVKILAWAGYDCNNPDIRCIYQSDFPSWIDQVTLNENGKTYVLMEDITAPKNGFVISGDNIILDGNGKTLTVNGRAIDSFFHSDNTIKNLVTNGEIRLYGATANRNLIDTVSCDNIVIYSGSDNIIRNSVMGGFLSMGLGYDIAKHNTLTGNTITGSAYDLVEFIGSEKTLPCPRTDHVITDNVMTDTISGTPTSAWATLRIRCATNNTIKNNTVRATGTAIGLYIRDESDNSLYENNTLWTNSAEALRISSGNVDKTFPANNIFHNNIFRSDQGMSHFIQAIASGNRFENNIFFGNADPNGHLTGGFGNIFDHNTFYLKGDNRIAEYVIYRMGPPADVYTNNIFDYSGPSIFKFDGFAFNRYDGDYNLFYNRRGPVIFGDYGALSGWRAASKQAGSPDDTNSIESDPLFMDAEKGDFRLQPNSPACTAANNGSYVGAIACSAQRLPPLLALINNQSVNENSQLIVQINAQVQNPNEKISLSWDSTPKIYFASFKDNGDGTGILTFRPNYRSSGVYTVTVYAQDNSTPPLQSSEPFVLTVNNVNRAPRIWQTMKNLYGGYISERTLYIVDPDGDQITNVFIERNGIPNPLGFITITQVDNPYAGVIGGPYIWVLRSAPGPNDAGKFSNLRVGATDNGSSPLTAYSNLFEIDNTAPVITGVIVSKIANTSAFISWITKDKPSTSQVEYGLNTAYGKATAVNTNPALSHGLALTNLAPNTTYHYRVRSKNIYGEAVSKDYAFKTTYNPIRKKPPLRQN